MTEIQFLSIKQALAVHLCPGGPQTNGEWDPVLPGLGAAGEGQSIRVSFQLKLGFNKIRRMCEEDVQEGPSRQEARLAFWGYLMKVLQMKRGQTEPTRDHHIRNRELNLSVAVPPDSEGVLCSNITPPQLHLGTRPEITS